MTVFRSNMSQALLQQAEKSPATPITTTGGAGGRKETTIAGAVAIQAAAVALAKTEKFSEAIG